VFVTGPGGTSRNLSAAVSGQPCTFVAGNESGIQVSVTCASVTPPSGEVSKPAVITGCTLDRQESGQFFLDVVGTNIAKEGFTVTVGGVEPKKVRVIVDNLGTDKPTTLRLLKKICNGLPGNIVITNPGTPPVPSAPFFCNKSCPSN